jgi:myo-inositol-1(or 4)-monophosphatase
MDDLELARTAAAAGAAVVLDAFGADNVATYKSADNPVTLVDEAAERTIVELIRANRPDDEFLAEETGSSATDARRRWLIDPLDGTVNFMNGIPHVAVSVALYEDGKALIGVVRDVVADEEFVAVRGGGASLNRRPLRVSAKTELGTAVIATGFPYDHKAHARTYTDWLAGVLSEVQGIRRFGAAALDFAWLAAGRFDGFYETGLGPWDVAAGILLVTEAGGTVTDPRGGPYGPGQPTMVASNGHLHDALLAAVASGLPPHLEP